MFSIEWEVEFFYWWNKWTIFCPKRWCITNIITCSNLDIIVWQFPKHKQNIFECAWKHFGTQNELWIKVNLDPMVKLKGLNKVNVHKVNDIHFPTSMGSMFAVH